MLGETVAVPRLHASAGVSENSARLFRPKSADSLLDHLANSGPHSVPPILDNLTESEVFVGDDDDDLAFSGDVQAGEEIHLTSELIYPAESNAAVSISYHEDPIRLPLDAVKEDAEAEAEEEASMGYLNSLSNGYQNLGQPSSLTSSYMSGCSQDDVSSKSNLHDSSAPSSSRGSTPSCDSGSGCHKPQNRDKLRVVNSESFRTSSSHGSSPRVHTCEPSESSSEALASPKRSRLKPTSSPRTVNSCHKALSPRPQEKDSEEKIRPRIAVTRPTLITEQRLAGRVRECPLTKVKENVSAAATHSSKTADTRDPKQSPRVGFDSRSATLGRRRKEKSEKEVVADKYGTLDRRHKTKSSSEHKECGGDMVLSKEGKETLDKYATLPRRHAREISSQWREQKLDRESPLRRSRSVGKGEPALATAARSAARSSMLSGSSLPSSGVASYCRSPRPTRKKESFYRRGDVLICMEVGVQTRLTGGDVVSAMSALSRQNSIDREEKGSLKSRVEIIHDFTELHDSVEYSDAEVQVSDIHDDDSELRTRLRRLIEDHTRLQEDHVKACNALGKLEEMQKDLEALQQSVEEERSEKEEIQGELDRTSRRVKEMLNSMEGVEREFNERGDSLIDLEHQLHNSTELTFQMQERISQYEDLTIKLRKDLDKSMAAQKILLQQVQDLEAEGREMADFMAEEKNALAECLREAESEMVQLRLNSENLSTQLQHSQQEAKESRLNAEKFREECHRLQAEVQHQARVHHSGEGSFCRPTEAFASRLRTMISKLMQDYNISDAQLEMIVTPCNSDSSSLSSTPEKVPTRPSQKKGASFLNVLISAMHGSAKEVSPQVLCGRNSPDGSEGPSECCEGVPTAVELDRLFSRFLRVCCVLKADQDLQIGELQDEMERLCTQLEAQQQLIDQQQHDFDLVSRTEARLRRELALVAKECEKARQAAKQVHEGDHQLQVMQLSDELEKLSSNYRHMESLHAEKETQLAEMLQSLSVAQGPAPPSYISEADHKREVAGFRDKVASLRQSVIERDRRISVFSERHSKDLSALREAELESHKAKKRLISTVDMVLSALEGIPQVVSGCPELSQLISTLTEASPAVAKMQNGFVTVADVAKDCNANPSLGDAEAGPTNCNEALHL